MYYSRDRLNHTFPETISYAFNSLVQANLTELWNVLGEMKTAENLRFQPSWISMVRPERFELPTPWFVAKYSIQMSYGR
jgi:hypothetical protein